MSTFLERKQRRVDTSGLLIFLEVSAASFAETLRINADTRTWQSNGVDYIGFPFDVQLPDDTPGQSPRARIVIDNVGRSITEDLERLQPGEVVRARLMVTDRADPNTYARVYRLPLTNVETTMQQVTAHCSIDPLLRQQAVLLRFDAFLAPGLH